MKSSFVVAAVAAVLSAAAAPAAFAHQGHQAAAPQSAEGEGVVKGIDPKGASVTLAHGPIAALKWPAMTMTFRTASPALVKGLSVGQSVHFVLKNDNGKPVVSDIHPK